MVLLKNIVNKLNEELAIESYGKDPGFSRFLPQAYESIGFDWQSAFEPRFTELFNGLMIKGSPEVGNVHLAVFPTEHVLECFLENSREGDLLFMHHPLLMECGDPHGEWGKGFVPIKEKYIEQIKKKNLSVYTCHEPLDYHKKLGTSIAIAQELNVEITESFLTNEKGENLILIGNIERTTTEKLTSSLEEVFQLPYIDFEGKKLHDIEKVAIVAGCGDKVDWMQQAESRGVQAYITGEVHCHIDNDYGKQKYAKMNEYATQTKMSLLGVSHAASEYLVKKTLINDWFQAEFEVETVLIPQEKWWL